MSEKKHRILILGSGGRLAASLAREWAATHEVTGLARPSLDVADLDSLRRLLDLHEFDVLVNGTGLTNVDRCETAREEARTVNALAPGIMAECASRRGARLIHFSTDYVFDGTKQAPYTEKDLPSPLGWYGATKREGEEQVLGQSPLHLVVRVSWVFGQSKPSFPDSLIERALRDERVEAIADKISCPTSAEDAAKWIEPFFDSSLAGGLYHACNSGECSWREYGAKTLEFASEAGLPLRTSRVEPIRLADMKQFIAPRPVFSILSTRKLAAATGITPRHWHEALREYIFKKYAPLLSPS
ncbi:MAG: dTDP-4-dehydrorhamnose reductase [Spartobacteria bacterium]